jgi:hypothetical protein
MRMKTVLCLTALSAALLASAPALAAQPGQCFRISDTGGWRVTPDARTMYMKVRINQVYEVQLRGACPALKRIGVHLVHKVNSDTVCSPMDFDLRVADNGVPMAPISCLVGGYRLLSPAEVAALPPKLRP